MQLRVVAVLAVSLLLCSQAFAQSFTVPGSDIPVTKDRHARAVYAAAGPRLLGRPLRVMPDRPARVSRSAAPVKLLGTPVVVTSEPSLRLSPPAPRKLAGASLIEVFDTANYATRRAILAAVPSLPHGDERRELLLRGLRHAGNPQAEFIAAVAAMTALQLGDEGKAILRYSLDRGHIRDPRAHTLAIAALQPR